MLLAACALVLAACGGGGGETEITPPDGAAATTPPAAAAGATPNPSTDPLATAASATGMDTAAGAATGGESVTAAPGDQVQTSEATPKAFVDALGKRTIMVVLHQPESTVDELVLAEARAACTCSGQDVLLLEYTVADYENYGDLLEKLGLFRAPSVAVVNRRGKLQNTWNGYVDRKLIIRAITISNGHDRPKVTAADAPPVAVSALSSAAADAAKGLSTAG